MTGSLLFRGWFCCTHPSERGDRSAQAQTLRCRRSIPLDLTTLHKRAKKVGHRDSSTSGELWLPPRSRVDGEPSRDQCWLGRCSLVAAGHVLAQRALVPSSGKERKHLKCIGHRDMLRRRCAWIEAFRRWTRPVTEFQPRSPRGCLKPENGGFGCLCHRPVKKTGPKILDRT